MFLVFASFGDGGERSLERFELGERLEPASLASERVELRLDAAAHAEDLRQGLGAHRGEGVEVAAGGAELRAELEGVRLGELRAPVRVVVRVQGRRVGHRRRHLVRRDPGRCEHGVSGRVALRARIRAIPGGRGIRGGASPIGPVKDRIHVDASADAREEVCAVISQRGTPREKISRADWNRPRNVTKMCDIDRMYWLSSSAVRRTHVDELIIFSSSYSLPGPL